jgi:hypothetical protein
MRTKKEVEAEIDWREKELEKIRNNPTSDNETAEYNQWRIQNLSFAVTWCKWFLNEK